MENTILVSLSASGVIPASSVIPMSGVLQTGTGEVTGAALTMEWSLAVFLILLELIVILLIWRGTKKPSSEKKCVGINLEKLISEQDGTASFSRFQFLIFTFIIASAYIVLAFHNISSGHGLPNIDPSVLGLIGISGGSYLASKGIEASNTPPNPASGTAATDAQAAAKVKTVAGKINSEA